MAQTATEPVEPPHDQHVEPPLLGILDQCIEGRPKVFLQNPSRGGAADHTILAHTAEHFMSRGERALLRIRLGVRTRRHGSSHTRAVTIERQVLHVTRYPSRNGYARVWWGRYRCRGNLLHIRSACANALPNRLIEGGDERGEGRTRRTGERNTSSPLAVNVVKVRAPTELTFTPPKWRDDGWLSAHS